jgi:ADP-heptose:LPS heptosyltransferase
LARGFVVANVSAHFADRDWSPVQCGAVLALLLQRHPDLAVVMTPAPGKTEPARQAAVRSRSERVVVAPELPLLELSALVRRAIAVITPNTALVHIASACHRPVVALYAPRAPGEVDLWLPLGVPYRALASRLGGTISDIPPTQVADAFDALRAEIAREPERPAMPASR